jgi:hypothetical protein
VIKEPDGRWQAINFDKRVSMDIEGKSAAKWDNQLQMNVYV